MGCCFSRLRGRSSPSFSYKHRSHSSTYHAYPYPPRELFPHKYPPPSANTPEPRPDTIYSHRPDQSVATQQDNVSELASLPATPQALQQQQMLPPPGPPSSWKKGELLGQGAFGRVYRGLDNDSGELIAVKQVHIAVNDGNKEKVDAHIRALEEEVNLLSTLQHENIVRYLGTESEPECLNIFLEYVPGGSIANLLQMFGPLDEAVIRKYTRQILAGLDYLHGKGIVHRDIKGANILIDNRGTVKLADFGASKKIENLATMGSGFKSIKGTPFWMAPEVIKQTGHGRPADIWSVGCTVIEMATGKPPWSNCGGPVAAMFQIASSKDPPPLPENLSQDGRDFLRQCFNRVARERADARTLLTHPFLTAAPAPRASSSLASSHLSPHTFPRHRSSPSAGLPPTPDTPAADSPSSAFRPHPLASPTARPPPAGPSPSAFPPRRPPTADSHAPTSQPAPTSLDSWARPPTGQPQPHQPPHSQAPVPSGMGSVLESMSLNPLSANMTLNYNPIQEPSWDPRPAPSGPPTFLRNPFASQPAPAPPADAPTAPPVPTFLEAPPTRSPSRSSRASDSSSPTTAGPAAEPPSKPPGAAAPPALPPPPLSLPHSRTPSGSSAGSPMDLHSPYHYPAPLPSQTPN